MHQTLIKCFASLALGASMVYFAEKHETVEVVICGILAGSVLASAIAWDISIRCLDAELDDATLTLESLYLQLNKKEQQPPLTKAEIKKLPPFPFKSNDPKFRL